MSSRPGPGSPKDQRQQREAAQQTRQHEAVAPAQPSDSSAVALPSPAAGQVSLPVPSPARAASPPSSSPLPVQPDSNSQARETPQVVADRVFKRMLFCMGAPLIASLICFPVLLYLKVRPPARPPTPSPPHLHMHACKQCVGGGGREGQGAERHHSRACVGGGGGRGAEVKGGITLNACVGVGGQEGRGRERA